MPVEATPRNMREYHRESYPYKDGIMMPQQPVALDPATGETFSATAGDYWEQPDSEPLRNEEGEPLVLVFKRTEYVDADEA